MEELGEMFDEIWMPTIQNLQHTLRIPSSIAELLGFTQARALGETFHKLVGMTCWFSLFQDPGHMLHVYIYIVYSYIDPVYLRQM